MSNSPIMSIPAFSYNLLYVSDVAVSEAFYAKLLQKPAIESSPGFALFLTGPEQKLGLWKNAGVQPAATAPGGSELAFTVANNGEVDQYYQSWQAAGVTIAQEPTQMDFGYTFVACDPDGHRLRVFALSL